MRRIGIAVIVVLMIGVAGAFAAPKTDGLAIGGQGSLYFVGSEGLLVSAHIEIELPSIPVMFGIGVSTRPAIGLTADYWAWRGYMAGMYGWYVGFGGYVTLALAPTTDIRMGVRLPIGLQAWLLNDTLEIYVETAPAVGMSILPIGFDWKVQAALGFRMWL